VNLNGSSKDQHIHAGATQCGSLFIIILSGVRLSLLLLRPLTGLTYQPRMIGDCGEIGGMKIGRGNQSTRNKTFRSATLSTTNPIWLDPGLNPGHCSGKAATNHLSYGAAINPVW
jgi:hypothetical protein